MHAASPECEQFAEVIMNTSRDPDFIPFREYCRTNGIGVSTAYELAKHGKLRITKIGNRSYVSREDRRAFREAVSGTAA